MAQRARQHAVHWTWVVTSMRKNAYAAKLMAAKAAMGRQERGALVNRTLTTVYQASAVALNEVYGFGPECIARFRGAMEAVVLEYGGLMDAVDTEYADDKLAERYEAIMGDLAYPEVSS